MDSLILTLKDNQKQQAPVCPTCNKYPMYKIVNEDPEKISIICPNCNTTSEDSLENVLNSMNPPEKLNSKQSCEADQSHSLQNAVCFCMDCEAWLCQSCKDSHLNSKTDDRRTHVFSEGGKSITKKCTEHRLHFTNYCNECKQNLCEKCKKTHEHQDKIIQISETFKGENIEKFNEFLRSMKIHSQEIGLLYQKVITIIDEYKTQITAAYEKTRKINQNIYKMYQSFIEQATTNRYNYHIYENLNNFGKFSFKLFKYDYTKLNIDSLNGKNLLEYKDYLSEGAIIIEKRTKNLEALQRIKEWTMDTFITSVNCFRDEQNKNDCIVFGFNNGKLGVMNLLHNDPSKDLFITKDSHRGRIISMHLNGNIIYTTGADQTIRKWIIVIKNNRYEIEPRAMFRGHEDEVYKVVTIPEKNTILSCSNDGTIIIWEPLPGQIIIKPFKIINVKESITSILVCKDNNHFITASAKNKLILWSLSEYKEKDILENVCCCAPGCLSYRKDDIIVYGNNKLVSISVNVEEEGMKIVDTKEFNKEEHEKMGITKDMFAIFQTEDDDVLMASTKKKMFKVNVMDGKMQVKSFSGAENIEGMYPLFKNKCAVVFGKKVEILSN